MILFTFSTLQLPSNHNELDFFISSNIFVDTVYDLKGQNQNLICPLSVCCVKYNSQYVFIFLFYFELF